MTDDVIEEKETVSEETDTEFLNMSDDEFDKLDLASLNNQNPPSEESDEHDEDERSEDEEDAESDDEEEEKTEEETTGEEYSEEDESSGDTESLYTGGTETSSEIDFESEYKKLTAPFKANGKDIQINSVDEAISLMQMGANYAKKMAGLKPNLKMMRMLEKQGLLDESKLSFLIDVHKKDPKAIQKLIKDSEIDPLDIDTSSEAEEYQPNNYSVADSEYAITEAFQEIEDTPSYARTTDIVGNKWDDSSKKVLVDNPQLIKIINSQVADGTYDKIMAVVEKERMLGKLDGASDIQAYKAVGDAMLAQGQLGPKATKPIAKKKTNQIRKKKAAISTKTPVKKQKINPDFNPLAMSDEEFEKLTAGKLF
jgi:hypothetical protein